MSNYPTKKATKEAMLFWLEDRKYGASISAKMCEPGKEDDERDKFLVEMRLIETLEDLVKQQP